MKFIRIYFFLSILGFFLLILESFSNASEWDPVVDHAHVLSQETVQEITNLVQFAHQRGKVQLQVYIVPDLKSLASTSAESSAPISIEQEALQLAEKLKLGTEKEDNGILFLISVNDRKMRIEVGQGLEGDLPDVRAKRIIADDVVPFLKQGDYRSGVLIGVLRILSFVDPENDYTQGKYKRNFHRAEGRKLSLFEAIGLIFFFFFSLGSFIGRFFPSLFNNGSGPWGRGGGGGWSGGGGGWSGGGGGWSGGGGGWSGGGGGFSGGGASGDW